MLKAENIFSKLSCHAAEFPFAVHHRGYPAWTGTGFTSEKGSDSSWRCAKVLIQVGLQLHQGCSRFQYNCCVKANMFNSFFKKSHERFYLPVPTDEKLLTNCQKTGGELLLSLQCVVNKVQDQAGREKPGLAWLSSPGFYYSECNLFEGVTMTGFSRRQTKLLCKDEIKMLVVCRLGEGRTLDEKCCTDCCLQCQYYLCFMNRLKHNRRNSKPRW